jgi:hypothetical protein
MDIIIIIFTISAPDWVSLDRRGHPRLPKRGQHLHSLVKVCNSVVVVNDNSLNDSEAHVLALSIFFIIITITIAIIYENNSLSAGDAYVLVATTTAGKFKWVPRAIEEDDSTWM